MIKLKALRYAFLLCLLFIFFPALNLQKKIYSQEQKSNSTANANTQAETQAAAAPAVQEEPVAVTVVDTAVQPAVDIAVIDEPQAKDITSENVTLDFKEADINNVLKIISLKSGVNIVSTPDVIGNITIRLLDVPWERALDIILKTYGYAYEKQGNIILVTKAENISKIQAEEPLKTELFTLKFLDAQDAMKVLIPLLSTRGKIAILYTKGQKGWKFGTFKIGKDTTSSQALQSVETVQGVQSEPISIDKTSAGGITTTKADLPTSVKSKMLIITDTVAALDRIRAFLDKIDNKPKQVLIEARIMEVNVDKLKDIGFDWGTGQNGASGYSTAPTSNKINPKWKNSIAGRNLASEFKPSVFNPLEGTTTLTGKYPYAAGLEVIFKKLTGFQFEAILHALEEDANTNTLSAPRLVTLDNQEASMLVGYHTPIITSTVTGGTTTEGPTQTQTLDYYQEIGIRLNVVPQISDLGYINMIVHPSVTSSSSSVTATSVAGTGTGRVESPISYPIIDVREAQTQIMMKDGETIVIGGLLKDYKGKEIIGIPYLSKIPVVGNLFKRTITDTQKIDLLIFITAHIVKDEEFNPQEITLLEQRLSYEKQERDRLANNDKKKKK